MATKVVLTDSCQDGRTARAHGEFVPSKEEWNQYAERMGHLFKANTIESTVRRKTCFLTLIGAPAYKLLGSLIAPDKPADKTYNDLVAVMKQHYCPKTIAVVQRFKFNSRVRQTGESVAVYVAELRRLANSCNYGAAFNNMLRDSLVVGINDDHIQRRLLAEGDLSFEKALEIALGIEAAAENARTIWSASTVSEEGTTVNQLSMKRVSAENTPCYWCGVMGHTTS